jgi:hypothetical protein
VLWLRRRVNTRYSAAQRNAAHLEWLAGAGTLPRRASSQHCRSPAPPAPYTAACRWLSLLTSRYVGLQDLRMLRASRQLLYCGSRSPLPWSSRRAASSHIAHAKKDKKKDEGGECLMGLQHALTAPEHAWGCVHGCREHVQPLVATTSAAAPAAASPLQPTVQQPACPNHRHYILPLQDFCLLSVAACSNRQSVTRASPRRLQRARSTQQQPVSSRVPPAACSPHYLFSTAALCRCSCSRPICAGSCG